MHDGAKGFQKQIQTHMTQKKKKGKKPPLPKGVLAKHVTCEDRGKQKGHGEAAVHP